MPNKIFRVLPSLNESAANSSLIEAQLKLFYLMLGANILKGAIYLFDALRNHQGDGSGRAIRLMVTSLILMLILRRFPKIISWGIHYAIAGTILHIYYRVFNRAIGADVVTLQAIFMVLISGYYGLGKKWGTVYAVIAFASVILYHYLPFRWTGLHPLPQNLNDLYIGINCLVIIMSHIYFHAVLFGNLRESELLSEKMTELAATKSNFLSTMSHELRTPLNSVIGLAGLLLSEESDAQQKEQLDVLKFSAEGLLTLINDILDFNKLEAGKLELEHVPFDLARLLKSIARGMLFKTEEKSLEFKLQIDPKIEGKRFFGDAARLSQVVYNLVGNAIKFTERGTVSLQVKVLKSGSNDYRIRFQVNDTGIGIPESRQKMIFEPFQQAEANTTRKFGGTGLGLSIVKQLIERLGSEITLKSVPGSGSSFSFDLLMKEDLSTVTKATGQQPDNSSFDLSHLSIMLAEDNMMNIFFMKQLFKRWNIIADIAENGQEVLNLLKTKNYDVILMDMHMPVMDGLEATRHIRNLPDPAKADTYIIALTASVSDQVQTRAKDYGMNDYLPKPFQLDDLKERLVNQLNKDLLK
ncbi:ATP-binding protein [Pedobacter sp. WC2423]|uniref:ATP-binding protein n=1 Tax=Pedobacter sp. WC2423 TaxID=3234142 RepID=UPI003466F561